MKTILRGVKASVLLATLVAVMALSILPASAHVRVDPSEASKGGYGAFTFRVPNEDPSQSTVKIEVQIPQDSPITYVGVEPKPGWSYSVEKTKLNKPIENEGEKITQVISKVTFEGGQIKPGEFDEFKISMGPLPEDSDSITLKAIQTYDGGKVSKWIEESVGYEEPEYPAPVVALTAEKDDHHASSSSDSKETAESNDSSNTVAYIALGVGVFALVVAFGAIAKKKS